MWIHIFGCIGFSCYFLYDINSVTKNYKIINKLFFLGTFFVAVGTFVMIWESREGLIGTSVRTWGMTLFSLCMFAGLIYTLFFAIPFKETYIEENRKRRAYTEGIYALCRHPGVLWFIGLYLGIAGMTGSPGTLQDALLYIFWNIAYIMLQDYYVFPRTFENYMEYKKTTPFLVPHRESIRRAIRTFRKGNE